MDLQLIQKLNSLTSSFYAQVATSFSSTRTNPWQGWQQLAPMLQDLLLQHGSLTVADFACGNLRFEDFLLRTLGDNGASVAGREESTCMQSAQKQLSCYAFDNCPQLMHEAALDLTSPQDIQFDLQLCTCDLMDALLSWKGEDTCIERPVQLAVSFGFMHHIPSFSLRVQALKYFASSLNEGAVLCVSLWQFMKSPYLAYKAQQALERACVQGVLSVKEIAGLEAGDMLLGWQESTEYFRYCHNFEEPEIENLVSSLDNTLALEERFVADGKSQDLNTYLVFRKK